MSAWKNILTTSCAIGLYGVASAQSIPDVQKNSPWYTAGASTVEDAANAKSDGESAKNVILFVGDGMGLSTLTAARILDGQRAGDTGEENTLSFESFPHTAMVKTYNTDQQTPDSAGTMTAMMTGVKSRAGVLSVSQAVARGNCASSKNRSLRTALEIAESQGKSTGVVSTARLTHATPAATYAHTPERNWESNDELSDEAVENGCRDIADQFVNFDIGNGIEVAFGGGRRHFLPKDVTDEEGNAGRRTDGRDLTQEWQQRHPDGAYVVDEAGFEALDPTADGPILGLFNSSHMQYEADRANDVAGEPSLSQMTELAIKKLQQNDDGYFLMVESGRIDHASHAGNAYNALNETIEYANAIEAARAAVDTQDTLILVTADHSHVLTIAGYPTRGNPILGKVVGNAEGGLPADTPTQALDGMPYTTVGYINGLGYADLGNQTDADARYATGPDTGRKNLANVDTTAPGFHQEALIPLGSETHAGEDISIHGIGPGSQLLQGVIEQNVVFHIIDAAAGLDAPSY